MGRNQVYGVEGLISIALQSASSVRFIYIFLIMNEWCRRPNYKGVIHKPCGLSRWGFENLKKYIRVTLQHHTNWSDLGEGVVFGKKTYP